MIGQRRDVRTVDLRAGDQKLFLASVAVARADGCNARAARAVHVKPAVADNAGMLEARGQRVQNQLLLVGLRGRIGRRGEPVKQRQQAEVGKSLFAQRQRLGGSQRDVRARALQRDQHRSDSRVHARFLPAKDGVPLAIDFDGFHRFRFGQAAVADEGIHQRRTDEAAQHVLAGNRAAHFLQRIGGASHDARRRLGDRSVQVENDGIVSHGKSSKRR